ncbi:MAG: hypothetical protein WBR28_11135 [Mycobacterium sp.]
MTATKPKFGSALDGYWGSHGSVHVNFIGTDDHLHELYIAPGAGWVDNDLSELAGATPPGNTALVHYLGSDGSQHVNFFAPGTDYNHVEELYIAPGLGWSNHDLTSLADGFVPNAGRALAGYWGSDNSQHVNYIGSDDHVHELYAHPGAAGWVDNDLTALSGGAAPLVGYPTTALVGYWGSDSSQHVNFVSWTGSEAHVHELYIAPGAAGWVDNDLTALAGAAKPRTGPPPSALAGYWGSDGSVHVNFLSVDGHVHELYIRPGASWVDNDLTALAGAVPAAEASPLAGYWGSDSSVHVNFIGTDGHVHELYIRPGAGWVDNDLTALAGAEQPALDTALAGYWGSDSSVHVNFIGTDGDVHELYIAPGTSWVDNNLTELA